MRRQRALRAFHNTLNTVDSFPPAVLRPAGLRSLERRLARVFWTTSGPIGRAELFVSIVRAFAVLTAMRTNTSHADTEQAEVERVLATALDHLQAVRHRQHEPVES